MATVNVSPNILYLVDARLGKQNRMQDEFLNGDKWGRSEKKPTLKQLVDVAKVKATRGGEITYSAFSDNGGAARLWAKPKSAGDRINNEVSLGMPTISPADLNYRY